MGGFRAGVKIKLYDTLEMILKFVWFLVYVFRFSSEKHITPSLSSLSLGEASAAPVTRVLSFSGDARASIPFARPLLGTRSLLGRAAGSCLSGWAPAAWVRGFGPNQLKLGLPLGDPFAWTVATEAGRRSWPPPGFGLGWPCLAV